MKPYNRARLFGNRWYRRQHIWRFSFYRRRISFRGFPLLLFLIALYVILPGIMIGCNPETIHNCEQTYLIAIENAEELRKGYPNYPIDENAALKAAYQFSYCLVNP